MIRGGDTDTNAAIVGGVIGALVGIKQINTNYIQALLSYSNSSGKGI